MIDSFSGQFTHFASSFALTGFYLYRRIRVSLNPGAGIPSFTPTVISERGNLRDLTDADSALFTIPADYTPLP